MRIEKGVMRLASRRKDENDFAAEGNGEENK